MLRGKPLALAAFESTIGLSTVAPWFSSMWLEHGGRVPTGRKQKLPDLSRPGLRSSRTSLEPPMDAYSRHSVTAERVNDVSFRAGQPVIWKEFIC